MTNPASNVREIKWQPEDFKVSHSYFVLMVDFGRDTRKVHGLEAIVDPEMTFNGAIDKVREIIGDGHEIAFIHHIQGSLISDVTEEMVETANQLRLEAAE